MAEQTWKSLPEWKQRRSQLRERLDQLEKSREKVSDDTFGQLKSKYEQELAELDTSIKDAQSEGEIELGDVDVRLSTARDELEQIKRELEELETLSISGTINDKEYRGRTRELQKRQRDARTKARRLEQEREQVARYLNAEEPFTRTSGKTGTAGSASPKASPAGVISGWIGERRKVVIVSAAAALVVLLAGIAIFVFAGPPSPSEVVESSLEAMIAQDGQALIERIPSTEVEQIEELLDQYHSDPALASRRPTALREGDGTLSPEEVEELDLAGLLVLLPETDNSGDFAEIADTFTVEQETIEDDTAVVEYRFEADGGNITREVELVRAEDTAGNERWLIPSIDSFIRFHAEDIVFDFADGEIPEEFEMLSRRPWTISTDTFSSAEHSLQSGNIGHRSSTTVSYAGEVPPRSRLTGVSFDRRVSSEGGYDTLRFEVNGSEIERWSGEEDWAEFAHNLDRRAGETYELAWTYRKDFSVSRGEDAAWIDNIRLTFD